MSEPIKVERKNEWDAGLNTTTGMWQLLSDDLADDEDVKLPASLNEAIYALREGRAYIVLVEK